MDKSSFNHQFLKFRVHYYFNETKSLLARHKLLTAFIICLLAPGLKNIQAIGIPFYALIDPFNTLKVKLFYLISLLLFLLTMTKAQLSFIKGGVFREYLHTLYIPSRVYKKIDFIILLFSLNLVWWAVFFGGMRILHDAKEPLFVASQYCLYGSMVLTIITLLLNCLYRKIANGIILLSALMLVVLISRQGSWILNYGTGCLVSLLSGAVIWTVQPFVSKKNYVFKIACVDVSNCFKCFNLLKSVFIIQWAVLKENTRSFLTRFIWGLALSVLILQILSSPDTVDNREVLVLVLVSLQSYILSTLFSLFEKGKLDHALFHKIFPYQRWTQPLKEVIIIWIGLVLILFPVFIFFIFRFKHYFSLLLILLAMNFLLLAINRILFAQSLRFCLFTSLLNTVGSCVVQYAFLEACFG